MNLFRVTSSVLIGASLLTVAACGGEDAANTAKPAPAVTAPASSAPSSPAAAGAAGASDKELCNSAKKAGNDMKTALLAALKAGEPTAEAYSKILTDLAGTLTESAASGGDGKVTAVMKQVSAEATVVAGAADPETADSAAFEKAGADLTAACKAVGVNVNF
ncbi:hypothetical protein [Actinoplanes sp. NPDC049118]|uniref:hypothetical protein n=1 Tax=Actinoplanes sp. NPDC049118 TaxID=3155769 RepID=UPI00340E5BAD